MPNADYVSVIRMMLDGEVPVWRSTHVAKNGYWYGVDEDGIPKYKGRAITEGEQLALNEATQNDSSEGEK